MAVPPNIWSPAILIVDDEAFSARALQAFLRRALPSVRILVETDPQLALATVARDGVAIVLADQVMDGLTGTDLLSILRRNKPDVRRILLTGHPVSVMGEREMFAAEPLKVFLKPVETAPFVEFLRHLLANLGGGAPAL